MDRDKPSITTAFNKIPIELNKLIAHHLPDDHDIANYRSICRATNYAVNGDHNSFWRARFRDTFALLDDRSNKVLRKQYQNRTRCLRFGSSRKFEFTWGNTQSEKRILDVLKDLIIESFKGSTIGQDIYDRPQCLNQVVLSKFVEESRLLLNNRRPPMQSNEAASPSPALLAIKLMCSHFLFNIEASQNMLVIAMEETQEAVYSPMDKNPIFPGPGLDTINMEYIHHCFKFFQHYMFNREASQLWDTMVDLEPHQQPSPWTGPLKSGSYPIGHHWKGTYAYLDHSNLAKIRARAQRADKDVSEMDYWIEDLNVDEGKLQSLYIEFVAEKEMKWPNGFEKKLQSKKQTVPVAPAQQSKKTVSEPGPVRAKNIGINGWGEDLDDQFYVAGWLNPISNQAEIPGWQRVTFMKFFEDEGENFNDDNLWAYEGVVLPGGKMILGRWWYASDDDASGLDSNYSGPFILWAVEPDIPLLGSDGGDDPGED